jgi:hypothetical protein
MIVMLGQAQNFVPDPSKFYNIIQVNTGLTIGPVVTNSIPTTQPAVVALTNTSYQAYQFIPVGGKTDTYYIMNNKGMYLNMVSTVSWDSWSTIFESAVATNSLYSEWAISGTDATSIRLSNLNPKHTSTLYIATDGITAGSSLYSDKSATNANGEFKLVEASIADKPVFEIPEKNEVQLEMDNSYSLTLVASGQNYTINATVTGGFFIGKSSFAPADFVNGQAHMDLMTGISTKIGDKGTVVFSYTMGGQTYYLDTVDVACVDVAPRYYILHKSSGLVVGKQGTSVYPALTTLCSEDTCLVSQQFVLRPVNKGVTDSLYYLVGINSNYGMLKKMATSSWDTEFGVSGNEAVWKLIPQADGSYAIKNYVTGKYLGTDSKDVNSRLYDDKSFVANALSSPYSEWNLALASELLDDKNSQLSAVTLSSGILESSFDATKTSYNVLLPVDAESTTITATAKSVAPGVFIDNNGAMATWNSPAEITCLSADASSSTKYTFSLSPMSFSDWAARGLTDASRTLPTQWGWKCTNAAWAAANATTVGTCRYIDNPAKYYTLTTGELTGTAADTIAYKGRVLYVRWDGNVTTSGVYSLPVKLEGGKTYMLMGKYAWNSVVPSETASVFTFGVNSAADNSGTSVVSVENSALPTELLQLHPFHTEFNAPTTGIYYFTMMNSQAILGAVADLSISELNAVSSTSANANIKVSSDGKTVLIAGTVTGDKVKVFNVSGQLIQQLNATEGNTSVSLAKGVYLIKVNNQVVKLVH